MVQGHLKKSTAPCLLTLQKLSEKAKATSKKEKKEKKKAKAERDSTDDLPKAKEKESTGEGAGEGVGEDDEDDPLNPDETEWEVGDRGTLKSAKKVKDRNAPFTVLKANISVGIVHNEF